MATDWGGEWGKTWELKCPLVWCEGFMQVCDLLKASSHGKLKVRVCSKLPPGCVCGPERTHGLSGHSPSQKQTFRTQLIM